MQSATEYWRDVDDVDAIQLPEGESLQGTAKERLTAERLDQLALFWACPEQVRESWNGPKDYRELALAVGCRLTSLPKWKRHPVMTKRITDYLLAAAVLAMPNILWGQVLAASPVEVRHPDGTIEVLPGDGKAANFVATVAKFIRSGMTVNQTQIAPTSEITKPMSDEDLDRKIAEHLADSNREDEAA